MILRPKAQRLRASQAMSPVPNGLVRPAQPPIYESPIQMILASVDQFKKAPSAVRKAGFEATAKAISDLIGDDISAMRQAAAAHAEERRREGALEARIREIERRQDFSRARMEAIRSVLDMAATLTAEGTCPSEIIHQIVQGEIAQLMRLDY